MTPFFVTERWIAWVLAAAAFCLPVVAIVAPLGVAVVGGVAGALALPFVVRHRAWTCVPPVVLLLPMALVAWGLASAPWAVDAGQAAKTSVRLAAAVLLGGIGIAAALAAPRLAVARIGLVSGFALAVLLVIVDELTGNGLAQIAVGFPGLEASQYTKRGVSVLALLIWPVFIALRRQLPMRASILSVLAASAAIFLAGSFSAKLALALGLGAAMLVTLSPRLGPRMVAAGIILVTLILPLASFLPPPHYTYQHWDFLSNSAHHRLTIWDFTSDRIFERPLTGWGMDSSRAIPGAQFEVVVRRYGGPRMVESTEPLLPLHPHNAPLQLWLELGIPGALALCALLGWVCMAIAKAPAGQRAALAGQIVATFAVATISYGIWQGWWQGALWLTGVATLIATRADTREV